MADLRDTIHAPKDDLGGMSDNELFLAYHDNSHYAQCRITAGLWLSSEARKYMKTDLERRARLEALFKAEQEKEKAIANAESKDAIAALHAADDETVQRDTRPNDTGHAANPSGASGEGTRSAKGTGGTGQGDTTAADVQPNAAGGLAACDDTLAR